MTSYLFDIYTTYIVINRRYLPVSQFFSGSNPSFFPLRIWSKLVTQLPPRSLNQFLYSP
ncbi:hypothetical protein Hanom_Chr09g00860741 [Helianthus anomalus]